MMDAKWLEPWDGGTALLVKVHPGARRDGVAGVHDGRLKVDVSAAPERGKANRALLAFLAKRLGLSKSALVLLAGETDPRKRIGVRGLAPDAVRARLGMGSAAGTTPSGAAVPSAEA